MKKLYILTLSLLLLFTFSINQNVTATYGGLNETKTITNLIENGDFSDLLSSWTEVSSNISIIDNSFNIDSTVTGTYGSQYQFDFIDEHIYYIDLSLLDSIDNSNIYVVINDSGGSGLNFLYSTTSSSFDLSTTFNYTFTGTPYLYLRNIATSIGANVDYDNIILIDLTDEFGATNEPTIEEFESMIANAPDYFETFTFNYNESTSNAVAVNAEYNVDNLIENGDFSDSDISIFTSYYSDISIINNRLFVDNDVLSSFPGAPSVLQNDSDYYLDFYSVSGAIYYSYFDYESVDSEYNNILLRGYGNILNDVDLIGSFSHTGTALYSGIRIGLVHDNSLDINDNGNHYLDNWTLIRLSSYYGIGNEPSKEQFESLVDTSSYADTYTYEDNAYMTVTQNNPVYQYYDNQDTEVNAVINLTLEDSLEGLLEVEPTIIINKYDLDMNYEGLIYEGNITDDSDIDADDKLEHNFAYTLPSPTINEEGYIYVAYDEEGGTVLGAGYVYNVTGDSFSDSYTGIRTNVTQIGIESSPYSESSYTDVLFDNDDFNEYIFNDTNSIITIHFSYSYDDIIDEAVMKLYSENTDQVEVLYLEYIYFTLTYYDDWDLPDPEKRGVFQISINDDLPPLLEFLNNGSYLDYNNKLSNWYDLYIDDFTNVFNDVSYADNKGVYTYAIEDVYDDSVVAIGESPLFYIDSFNTFDLPKHIIKAGNPFTVQIDAEDSLLINDSYDYQYVYDNNTNIYTTITDLSNTSLQTIYVEIFEGLSDEGGTLSYTMTRGSNDYNNGANYDTYDIYIRDDYEITVARSLEEISDSALTSIGINDTLGKILITFVVMIALGVLTYFKSKNYIATLIVVFIVLGLAFVLGFIEAWIILLVIMIFTLLMWYVFKNTTI